MRPKFKTLAENVAYHQGWMDCAHDIEDYIEKMKSRKTLLRQKKG